MKVYHYNSMVEVMDRIRNVPRKKGAGDHSVSGSFSFTQTNSMEEAIKMVAEGWTEGAGKVRSAIRLAQKAKSGKRTPSIKWDVAGGFVDIGKYMSGEPECMGNIRTRVSQKGKSIEQWRISVACSSMVSSKMLMLLATEIAVAIARVEARGKRVRLILSSPARYDGGVTSRTDIVIKNAGEAISPAKLAFACGHPSIQRRILFALTERGDEYEVRASGDGSYGRPDKDEENRSEYIGGLTSYINDSDVEKAIAIVKAM